MPSGKAEPPLETVEFVRDDERAGCRVEVKRHQRGVLRGEAITYPIHEWFQANRKDARVARAREKLDLLSEVCRDKLEELGFPSDRTYDGFKNALKEGRKPTTEEEENFKSLWVLAAWQQAEPLSAARCAADLLWSLNHLLVRDEIHDQLALIFDCMIQFYQFCVAVEVNNLAVSGLAASTARKAGPQAKKANASAKRRIICAKAKEYWSSNAHYRNDASNTADRICDSVNEEFERLGLVPKSGRRMSKKTMADHIRLGLCGKKLKTGQSGNRNS